MADRYWVGGSGTWLASGSSANWSTSDGGPSGASSPSTTDNAFFTANSNIGSNAFTVTTNLVGCNCANLTISGLDGTLTIAGTNALNVYGSLTLPSTNLVWSLTGTLQLFGTSTGVNKNITTNGFVIASPVTFTNVGTDRWILQDALTVSATCTLSNGNVDLNNYTLTCNTFSTNNSNARSIAFGTLGTIVVAGAGGNWSSATMTNFSYTGISNIRFTNPGATTAAISTSGATLAQTLNFYITAGTYTLNLTSTGAVLNLDFTGFSGTVSIATGGTFTFYGNIIYSPTMTVTSSTGTLNFSGNAVTQTITTNGVVQNYNIGITGTNNTLQLIGNFTQLSTRSLSLTTGTLDINSATTSIGIFTINSGTHAIVNGTVNCASVAHNDGDLSIGTGYTVIVSGTYTFTAGTITINDGVTLSVGLFSSANSNTRSIAFGTGAIALTSTGTVWNTSTVTNFSYTGTSNVRLTNSGSTATTITAGAMGSTQALNFYITAGTYVLTTTTGGVFNILDFTGFNGTHSQGITTITVYGNLIYSSTMLTSVSSGSITMASTSGVKTITTNGNSTINNTIILNGTGGTFRFTDNFNISRITLTNGTLDINSKTANVSSQFTITSGTHAITNGTLNCASVVHTTGDLSIGTGYTVIVSGTYTFTAGTITINDGVTLSVGSFSSANSNARSIAFGTGAINLTSTGTIWNTATVTNFSYTGTSNIRLTNGGSTAITVSPGAMSSAQALNFYITAGSYTLTFLSVSGYTANNVDFTGFNGIWGTTNAVTIFGNLTLSPSMTLTGSTSTMVFGSTSSGRTIATNGKLIETPITFNGIGGSWVLQNNTNVSISNVVTLTNGTLDLNGYTFNTGTRFVTGTGTKNLTFNGGTLLCPVSSATAFNNIAPTGFTTTAGSAPGIISMSGASAKTFVGGSTVYAATLSQDGLGNLTITGSNTFTNIRNTVQPTSVLFTAGTTTTVSNLTLSGTPGNTVTISSATAATHTLLNNTNNVSVAYCNISYSAATGSVTWKAPTNYGNNNLGFNTGWDFTPTSTTIVLSNMIAFF